MTGRMHKVEKRGALFYVVASNGQVTGRGYARREDAEESLGDLLRSSQRGIRTCMSCRKPFESEGSHNRMCDQCKRRSIG
jgi:hypothetical protein